MRALALSTIICGLLITGQLIPNPPIGVNIPLPQQKKALRLKADNLNVEVEGVKSFQSWRTITMFIDGVEVIKKVKIN